jgi:hypothetical protein
VHGSLQRHHTNVSYTFGKGTATGLFQVILPVQWNTLSVDLRIDIVPGDLPLLLSKKEQKQLGTVLDSARGELYIPDPASQSSVVLPLTETVSGHWLVPLRWPAP